jgi:hypothetical protein
LTSTVRAVLTLRLGQPGDLDWSPTNIKHVAMCCKTHPSS